MQALEKHDWRKFNRTLKDGSKVYLAWVEGQNHAVFQKEFVGKNYWDIKYGTVRVHMDDMYNGNFEYMIENNLTRFN